MTESRRGLISMIIAALSVVGGAEVGAQLYEVSDSAGVAIVVSGPSRQGDTGGWSLSAEPILTIGQLDGDEAYLFTHVWDALRTPDGRLVVVEGSVYEIRVYNAAGTHLITFGGRGGGPGEFGGPPWISLAGVDTLVVWDPGHYRLSHYSLDGSLIDQMSRREMVSGLGIQAFPNGRVWHVSSGGFALWNGPVRGRHRGGRETQYNRFTLLGPETHHDFGRRPSGEMYSIAVDGGSLRGIGNPFAPASVAGVRGDGTVVMSDPERFEVAEYRPDGTMSRVLRGAVPRVPFERAMREEWRGRASRMVEGSGLPLRMVETAYDRMSVPDSLPAIGRLLWDTEGRLWIGRRSGDLWTNSWYHVFDADGRWTGAIETGDGFGRLVAAGEDYVLATGTDQFAVQYLNVYRLEKGRE